MVVWGEHVPELIPFSLRICPLSQVVKFAVASGDKRLKIIHSDLDEVNRCTFLDGHTDYINDVVFLENGHQVLKSSKIPDHSSEFFLLLSAHSSLFLS